MAENILNISLKDYRQQIAELQAALLNLKKGTEEYDKVAQEAKDKQDKLNQVLYDSKNGTQAAENSMNALKATLKELKSEVGNLDMGSERFKEVSQQILDVNNKLKEAEAQMGIFGRNVGNYTNSIVEAFGKMGVNLGPIGPLLTQATAAGGSFGTMFKSITTLMKTNVIFLAISAAVGVFMKLKSAIQGNEETSRKWAKAMSTFQPIINGINNAIDWLATALVNVISYVSASLPKVVKFVGSAAKSITNVLGSIVDIILWIPTQAHAAMSKMTEYILKGVNAMAGTIAGFLKKIGLDEIANGLTSAVENASKTINSFNKGVDNLMKNAGNYVKQVGNGIDNAMKSVATSMETTRKLEQDRQNLEEEGRKRQLEGEESLLKQQKLRDAISQASGEEKLRLQKELKNEIIANGKKEVEYAKKAYDIKYRESQLTANSAKDNKELVDLRTKVVSAEANYYRELVRVDKQITTNEKSLDKATETTKKNTAATNENAESVKKLAESYKRNADEIMSFYSSFAEAENYLYSMQEASFAGASAEQTYQHNIRLLDAEIEALKSYAQEYEKASNDVRLKESERLEFSVKLRETNLKIQAKQDARNLAEVKENTRQLKKFYADEIKDIEKIYKNNISRYGNIFDLFKGGVDVVNSKEWLKTFNKSYKEFVDGVEREYMVRNPLTVLDKVILKDRDGVDTEKYSKDVSDAFESIYDVFDNLPKEMQDSIEKGKGNGKDGIDYVANWIIDNIEKIPDELKPAAENVKEKYGEIIADTFQLPDNIDFLKPSELFGEIQNTDLGGLTAILEDVFKPLEGTNFDFDFSSLHSIEELPKKFATKFAGLSDEAKKILEPEFTKIKELLAQYAKNSSDFTSENFKFIDLRGNLEQQIQEVRRGIEETVKQDNPQLEGEGDIDYMNRIKGIVDAEAAKNEKVIELQQQQSDIQQQLEQATTNFIVEQYKIREKIQENAKVLKDKEVEHTKKSNESIIKSTTALAKSTSSLMGSVADIMQNNIDMKVKNGEISEEQAKEEFERVKKVQIAQTIINTLAGAVGAFMQDKQAYPSPWNYIIAGTDMATTLATGWAQLQQIKSTEYGSTSSSGGGSSSSGSLSSSVNPLLNEGLDERSMDTLRTEGSVNSKDTRVWISQTDLEDSHNQVETRENDTTF